MTKKEDTKNTRAPQSQLAIAEAQGFGTMERRLSNETAAAMLATQAKAIVEARYIVALQRKRDPDRVRQRLLHRCENPNFAEAARYMLPARGRGEPISGLSIRFVEAAIQEMGNIWIESIPILDDQERRLIRVSVTDLETNTGSDRTFVISKTVERRQLKEGQQAVAKRLNSFGELLYIVEASEEELAMKEAAITSKVRRSLGMQIIDGGLADECEEKITETIDKKIKDDPDRERKRLIDGFGAMGIRVEDLKAYVGTELDRLTPADYKHLREVWTGLKEGHTTWADVVEARAATLGNRESSGQSRSATLLEDLRKGNAQPAATDAPTGSVSPKQANLDDDVDGGF